MSESPIDFKVYVITNNTKLLQKWYKSFRAAGIVIIGITPENAFFAIMRTIDADIIVIDSNYFREWVRNYLVNYIVSLFPKDKAVIMTDKFEPETIQKAKELKAHGYIYRNVRDSSICEALITIAGGKRTYFNKLDFSPKKSGRFYAIRNSILEKVHSLI